jgi:uridine kinase
VEDLEALRSGRAIVDPVSGAPMAAGRYILFETQFGRRHAASGRNIDFLVWLDVPLDIALARKIRQFTQSLGAARPDEIASFVPWLGEYLQNYMSFVGDLLRIQTETVAGKADLVVDGRLDPEVLAAQVTQEIRARLR